MKRYSILFLLLAAACNPYNRYCSPPVATPMEWKGEAAIENISEPIPSSWWTLFEDPLLNCLEERAVANNYDLEKAWYAYKESVALSCVARSRLFPQATLDPSYDRLDQQVSFDGLPGAPGSVRLSRETWSFPFDAQYQVDLWNQLGLEARAAALTAQSLCWALRSLRISITAQVAENYFSIRTLDAELEVLRRNIKSRQDQVEVTSARYDAGLINYTDVTRAQTELSNARADYEDVYRARVNFINALAVLVGEAASCFNIEEYGLQRQLPQVPAGLPSELVCMRPDVREAERKVAAAHAEIGAAWASFFPSFSLQGTLGYSSPFYSNLFTWQARLWAYAYNISQVIFDAGATWCDWKAAKDVYFQNVAAYQQTVLIAFREVEDALANLEYRRRQEENLIQSVHSSSETLDLIKMRYDRGVVDYLDVVDAERTSLEAERSEVRTRGAQFIATVALIRALGGGWE